MSDDTLLQLQLAAERRAHDATMNWLAGVSAWAVIMTIAFIWSWLTRTG